MTEYHYKINLIARIIVSFNVVLRTCKIRRTYLKVGRRWGRQKKIKMRDREGERWRRKKKMRETEENKFIFHIVIIIDVSSTEYRPIARIFHSRISRKKYGYFVKQIDRADIADLVQSRIYTLRQTVIEYYARDGPLTLVNR